MEATTGGGQGGAEWVRDRETERGTDDGESDELIVVEHFELGCMGKFKTFCREKEEREWTAGKEEEEKEEEEGEEDERVVGQR